MRVKFGPWQPDQADLDQSGLEECVNCIPRDGYYTAIRENVTISGSSTVAFASNTLLVPADDGAYLFVGGQGSFMRRLFLAPYVGSGATPNITSTDVARTATYTGSTSAWAFVRFGSTVLAANGYDAMQVGSISTNFRDQSASASAPVCKVLATVRDFVFAGNITSGGAGAGANRVQWCQINNPQRWTPSPRNQSDFQDLPDSGEILAMTGGDFAAILTRHSVWRATYVGSPVIFRFDEVAPRVECLARASVARYQNLTFFLSRSGFQVFDGAQCIPIGSDKVDRYALEFVERVAASQVLGGQNVLKAVIDPVNRLYVATLKNRSVQTKLLLYDLATGQWSEVDVDDIDGGSTQSPLITESLVLAAGASGAPEETVFRYTTDRRLAIGFFRDWPAQVYSEFCSDTSFMTATFATGEAQIFPDKRAFVTGVRPLIQGHHDTSGTATTAITVEVGKRNVLTESVSYGAAVSINANGMAPLRADARYHRVRVNVSGGFERAIGFDIDAKPSGKR